MSTILVVDDAAICREPIETALQHAGYRTLSAGDGAEALKVLERERTDLVLLDMTMPGADGLVVLRAIRHNPLLREVPVIILTGASDPNTVKQAATLGIQGYILKTQFSLEKLLERVNACVRGASGGKAVVTPAAPVKAATPAVSAPAPSMPVERAAAARAVPAPAHSRPVAPVAGAAAPAATRGGDSGARRGAPPSDSKPEEAHGAAAAESGGLEQLSLVISEAELHRLIDHGLHLKPLQATVHNVVCVCSNAHCSADDVAKAVSVDHALCIMLMKLAHSSAYLRGRPVDSVRAAVQRIGTQEIRRLVTALGVVDRYEGKRDEHFDALLFWEHSIACGLIASSLARARSARGAEDYFLWGLLHDAGRLILHDHVAERYELVCQAADRLDLPLEVVEQKMLPLDHCGILAKALGHWKFPPEFIPPVVNHHLPAARIKRQRPEQHEPAATVALANRLAHAMLLGCSGNAMIYPISEFTESLRLSPATIDELTRDVPDETNNLKVTMLSRAEPDAWPDYVAELRGKLCDSFRPLYVSDSGGPDAVRIFCERLSGAARHDQPNVGVIHMRDAADQATNTSAYEARERKAGVGPLPVLMLFEKGQVNHDHAWLHSRRHAALMIPFSIRSFIPAVNELLSKAE
ncbi:MAG: HDOD domain-containing protein [Planctomycetes bacterium]|nr:HDOD domain-containing protein [Planctomycetota bacterium]